MRILLTLILFLSIVSCSKNKQVVIDENILQDTLTVKKIIDSIIGNYTTTRICEGGSNISGYNYDTSYNIILKVEKENDSMLLINGYSLSFYGDLATKYYHFYLAASGGGQHAIIDSTFTTINFSYWSGGLGGGSGCSYKGYKL
jgi:hypothetical protein